MTNPLGTQTDRALTLPVRVIPNARTNAADLIDGVLRLKVTAQPEQGKANKAVISSLATLFQVTRKQVFLHSGETSRNKQFLITAPYHTPLGLRDLIEMKST